MNTDFLSNPTIPIDELPCFEEASELVAMIAAEHVRSGDEITDADLSYSLLRALAAVHDDIEQDLSHFIATVAAVLIVRHIPDEMKRQALENDMAIKLH